MHKAFSIIAVLLVIVGIFVFPDVLSAQKKQNKKGEKEQVNYGSIIKANDDLELVVSGEGSDLNDATAKALRSAIEQTYGAFVSASSTIINDELIKDEIATVASGNIKAYRILSSSQLPNGQTSVSLQTMVSIGKLVQYAQSKGAECEFAGDAFAMEIKMRNFNKRNERQALRNMIKQLECLKGSLFDYSLMVGTPQRGGGKDIKGLTKYPVPETTDYYYLPIAVGLIPNSNYVEFKNIILNTFSALSLTESEINQYKSSNDDYYTLEKYIITRKHQYDPYHNLFPEKELKYLTGPYYFRNGNFVENIINWINQILCASEVSFAVYDISTNEALVYGTEGKLVPRNFCSYRDGYDPLEAWMNGEDVSKNEINKIELRDLKINYPDNKDAKIMAFSIFALPLSIDRIQSMKGFVVKTNQVSYF